MSAAAANRSGHWGHFEFRVLTIGSGIVKHSLQSTLTDRVGTFQHVLPSHTCESVLT